MTNLFLKVNKDFFKLGLNPTEILLLAQIAEFNTNTGDCFMSDKAMAEAFGVSESTVSRALKNIENKGFIIRATKNTRTGKERHITVNTDKIEEALATVKMTDGKNGASVKMTVGQQSNCVLPNTQNDFIKDNLKEKEKDNIGVDRVAFADAHATLSTLKPSQAGRVPGQPIEKDLAWFRANFNHHEWRVQSEVARIYQHIPSGIYYKILKD